MSGFIDTVTKASEVAKIDSNQPAQRFDADKRIDAEKTKPNDGKEKHFDPDKRIDVKETLDNTLEQYKEELLSLVDLPDTIKNLDDLKVEDLKKRSRDETAEKRKEFNDNRNKLRTEWEKINNRPWPTYDKDVLNSRGETVKKAGMKKDAHHIKPLGLGGENEANNITPVDVKKHAEIHSADSAYSALEKAIT